MIISKINISKIIHDHILTLRNSNTNKPGIDDYFTFLILPILIASLLMFLNIVLGDGAVKLIIATLFVIAALFFNIIVLIFDIIKRDSSLPIKNQVLKELISNISFCILLSLITIMLSLATLINVSIIKLISNWLVFFLLSLFFFTILMIIKRFHYILEDEFENLTKNKKK